MSHLAMQRGARQVRCGMPHKEIVAIADSVALVVHTDTQPLPGIPENATFSVFNFGPRHVIVTGWGWRLSSTISPAPGQVREHVIPMWEVLAPGAETAILPFADKERWLQHLGSRVRGDKATLQNLDRAREVLVAVRTLEDEVDLSCEVTLAIVSNSPWTIATKWPMKQQN